LQSVSFDEFRVKRGVYKYDQADNARAAAGDAEVADLRVRAGGHRGRRATAFSRAAAYVQLREVTTGGSTSSIDRDMSLTTVGSTM
jgi:hypothetical protein